MSELEDVVNQLQVQNQQLQVIMMQKQSLLMQGNEVEKALEEIEKHGEEIYKSVGPLLVKTAKGDIKGELSAMKEEVDLKIKTLENQEKRLKEKLRGAQEKFQTLIPKHQGQGG